MMKIFLKNYYENLAENLFRQNDFQASLSALPAVDPAVSRLLHTGDRHHQAVLPAVRLRGHPEEGVRLMLLWVHMFFFPPLAPFSGISFDPLLFLGNGQKDQKIVLIKNYQKIHLYIHIFEYLYIHY